MNQTAINHKYEAKAIDSRKERQKNISLYDIELLIQ